MTDNTDLSTILGEEAAPAAPAAEVVPEPVTETVAPEPEKEPVKRDEAGRFAAEKPETMVPLAALMAEREKARELEKRLTQATPPREPAKAPDVFAEPEKFAAFMQQQASEAAMNAKLDVSEAVAREAFGDGKVDAAFEAYKARAAAEPELHARMMAAKSPWHAVVRWHETEQARAEIGDDPAAYRAKIEAELRAKIEAEMASKATPAAPPSLAGSSNLGGRGATPAWSGPTPLNRILRA